MKNFISSTFLSLILWIFVLGIILTGDYVFHELRNIESPTSNIKGEACYVGGCSGQICSDEEGIISTCEFKPEYACYAKARCERQKNGKCEWTETSELKSCIALVGQ